MRMRNLSRIHCSTNRFGATMVSAEALVDCTERGLIQVMNCWAGSSFSNCDRQVGQKEFIVLQVAAGLGALDYGVCDRCIAKKRCPVKAPDGNRMDRVGNWDQASSRGEQNNRNQYKPKKTSGRKRDFTWFEMSYPQCIRSIVRDR